MDGYHLVAFDAEGWERSEEDGPRSRQVLREAAEQEPTDVFVFSHGWMGDVPAAREQYGRWLAAMASCTADRAAAADRPGGFRPLLVGLHWPSKAWGDEELSPASFTTEPGGGPDAEQLVDWYAAQFSGSPAAREALWTIVRAAYEDAAPVGLPEDVRRAYQVLDATAGLGAEGEGGAPGDDRARFDAEATYQACQLEELTSYGGLSLGGILAPLRVLTFWQMKARARQFGETGAAGLLGALRQAAPQSRIHLMGHSFGCIVTSAAVAAARVPVDTLMLVQGAMSLWSFCAKIPGWPDRTGYFRRVVADRLVTGPVLVTTSVHDRAVRVFYPLGAGARGQVDYQLGELPTYGGIGTFGVRGPGVDIVDGELPATAEPYELDGRVVHNLRADKVIREGGGVMGAHSDIAKPPVAHALWQAVLSGSRGTGGGPAG